MLTEGNVGERASSVAPAPRETLVQKPASSVPAAPQRQPQTPQPRQQAANPFRSAQALGKHSLEAAVDMFKALGAQEERRDAPTPRAPEQQKPASSPRGDLFDDQEDADLEIPSFLRKKKTG